MNKNVIIRLSVLLILLGGIFIGLWLILQNSDSVQEAEILERIYRQGNYIEAGIWFIFAGAFAVSAIKSCELIRLHRIVATFTFLLFSLSDIVEVQTGAWWHPWWLFVWKSLCVFSMFCLLMFYLKFR
ncbi:hypothetical protein [Okeania sp.]|uniref:hypothetical protein n=1 Tax=Okeania sp. TaxID=3100323 RepID=UPI002B4AB3C7|nr:hypothetical protein [Okeania sp.]MEB3340769.1 hypothetical protein [Okeania sp.]